ncbi:tRNA (guanosine(18)-2'-O)-methyltransferase TrmH [Catenovulum sp. 2E275]|uniref:tRNA (guanosine(18)-2'-O)-methyltransferase TrmH n=1 Tax=Catenovulum sp. 2E275 TaxID=2980497 RepID=UPI0021D2C5BE|nr:tRNA (guanosine(18)-2'-O)-methyltransferase TrmH [Catenovulum sp. 2E275]MCU4675111.1 tRNA (guanosine(18)-2'-O)-methyltransferase TrmH [Catenovulum sp. 2E275]
MTPERLERILNMLRNRQPDLTVCLEEVHKTHNLSAIIRTADSVGIHNAHAILKGQDSRVRSGTAKGSQNWVKLITHEHIESAVDSFKTQGMQVLATNLSEKSVDYREIDYTQPTAIIYGQEKYGISEKALELADKHIVIPMLGMAESLNVSVANGLILYEAMRQRQAKGMYGQIKLPLQEQQRILFERGYPVFAELCRQKNLAYPVVNELGEIEADDNWWQKMQTHKSAWL